MDYWVCSECNRKIATKLKSCPYCRPAANSSTPEAEPTLPAKTPSLAPGEPNIEVSTKYPAMSTISIVIKVVAALVLIIGVLTLLIPSGGLAQKAAAVGITAILAVILWSYSEAIDIAVDIESNQRKLIKILMEKL
ncbi:hypothetical protein FY034_07415 [Trichlorobacter lovleyi]|uniref:hypothetical protein n=1 Tax=Trichlorobacter lovleyi TaxID=313985 RepID=UPI00223F6D89|nr:hypothetical protein [Trichlorobacter lovleyi]QOX78765.1 hypothetical protein FY034_07415 [Trichlorobacter lovleyi]